MDPRIQALAAGLGTPYLNSAQPPLMPSFNIPGASPSVQMLLQMFLEPALNSMVGRNWFPTQLFPENQVATLFRNREQLMRQQGLMAHGLDLDRQVWQRYIRSAVEASGVRWNASRQREMELLSRDITPLMSGFAMVLPDMYDSLMGPTGSAYIMAGQTFLAGRGMRDPVTGTIGMSDRSMQAMNTALYSRFFEGADPVGLRYGFGAGRVGMMVNELMRRGYAPASLSAAELRDAGALGGSPASIASLIGGLGPIGGLGALGAETPGRGGAMSAGSTLRTSLAGARRSAEYYAQFLQALAAVRDAFGDAGMPGATIPELMNALENLTQGGISSVSGRDLSRQVRRIQALNATAMVDLPMTQQLVAQLAGMSSAYGFDRRSIPNMIPAIGVSRTAYTNTWSGVVNPHLGTPEQMAYREAQLRAGAQGSRAAHEMAAMQGLAEQGMFRPGTEAAAIADAIRAGNSTYEFGGRTRNVYERGRSLFDIASRDAASPDLRAGMAAYFNSSSITEPIIRRTDSHIGELARRAQWSADISEVIDSGLGSSFGASSNADVRALGRDRNLMQEIREGFRGRGRFRLRPDQFGEDLGVDAMMRMLADSGIPPAQLRAVRLALSTGLDRADQLLQGRRQGRLGPQLALQHEDYLNTRSGLLATNTAQAELDAALSGLNATSPLARIMGTLATARADTPISDVVMRALGRVPAAELLPRLRERLSEIQAQMDALRRVRPGDTAALAEHRAMLERMVNQMRDEVDPSLTAPAGPDAPLSPEARMRRDVSAVGAAGAGFLNSLMDRFMGPGTGPRIPTSELRASAASGSSLVSVLTRLVGMLQSRRLAMDVSGTLNIPGFGDMDLAASSSTVGVST